jgi:hypothetical protein
VVKATVWIVLEAAGLKNKVDKDDVRAYNIVQGKDILTALTPSNKPRGEAFRDIVAQNANVVECLR